MAKDVSVINRLQINIIKKNGDIEKREIKVGETVINRTYNNIDYEVIYEKSIINDGRKYLILTIKKAKDNQLIEQITTTQERLQKHLDGKRNDELGATMQQAIEDSEDLSNVKNKLKKNPIKQKIPNRENSNQSKFIKNNVNNNNDNIGDNADVDNKVDDEKKNSSNSNKLDDTDETANENDSDNSDEDDEDDSDKETGHHQAKDTRPEFFVGDKKIDNKVDNKDDKNNLIDSDDEDQQSDNNQYTGTNNSLKFFKNPISNDNGTNNQAHKTEANDESTNELTPFN